MFIRRLMLMKYFVHRPISIPCSATSHLHFIVIKLFAIAVSLDVDLRSHVKKIELLN